MTTRQQTLTGKDPLVSWYHRHRGEYFQTRERLQKTRSKFEESSQSVAGDMLRKSYVQAVISQMNTVEIYEPAYVRWANGNESMESAFESINYNQQKIEWILDTSRRYENTIGKATSMLRDGNLHEAIRYMANNFKGLGYMKASFTAAMLGYTSVMCIDTNIQRGHSIDMSGNMSYSEYREKCDKVSQDMSEIEEDPFIKQWISFDYQRAIHEPHRPWFQSVDTWELDRE